MNVIHSILSEFGPCSTTEVLDYIRSDFFYLKGHYSSKEWTRSKIRDQLNRISRNNDKVFKFHCNNGFKVRYGASKFEYFILQEPRYLKVKGYIKRCMFCGMPIYIENSNVFHFKYKCKQYKPQEYFKLLKLEDFWAIISRDYVYGILDDLHSCTLRLPGRNENKSNEVIFSELWLINKMARKRELIEPDRLLSIKAEEFIT
ncbi:MAG: hypothetical protein ACTSRI_06560 [Promethearchaeota archaeon]